MLDIQRATAATSRSAEVYLCRILITHPVDAALIDLIHYHGFKAVKAD